MVTLTSYPPPLHQVLLVTGGYDGEAPLASTELLLEAAGAWTEAGTLPSPRYGLRAASLASTVVVTGEHRSVTSRAVNGTSRNFTVPGESLN